MVNLELFNLNMQSAFLARTYARFYSVILVLCLFSNYASASGSVTYPSSTWNCTVASVAGLNPIYSNPPQSGDTIELNFPELFEAKEGILLFNTKRDIDSAPLIGYLRPFSAVKIFTTPENVPHAALIKSATAPYHGVVIEFSQSPNEVDAIANIRIIQYVTLTTIFMNCTK